MALLGQREGAFGISYESTPGTPLTGPVYYLPGEDGNIEMSPVTYERINNIGSEVIGAQQAGSDVAFSFSGLELSVEVVGYLVWLALGAEDNTTPGTHIITPQFDQPTFTIWKDFGGTVATAVPSSRTLIATGCRLDSLSIMCERKSYAKISGSGIARGATLRTDTLTPSLDLSANAAPLSWNALRAGAFGIGSGGGTTQFDAVKSVGITIERELARAGANLDSDDPSDIVEGGRPVTLEIGYDLDDTSSQQQSLFNALYSGTYFEADGQFNIGSGSRTLDFSLPYLRVTDPIHGPLTPAADPQEGNITARAYQAASSDTITVTSVDGDINDYSART